MKRRLHYYYDVEGVWAKTLSMWAILLTGYNNKGGP